MFNPLKGELDKLQIVLATSSKQRQAILKQTKLKFDVIVSNYAEDLDPTKFSAEEYVKETAYQKVKAVHDILRSRNQDADIIIGLDTMVVHNGNIFGKPKDEQDAIETITKLTSSKIPNEVLTGVSIKFKNHYVRFTESTKVYMKPLTEAEILGYVETGEPMGHAGSYAIQGIAGSFVERIDGDYNNVIGLPLCAITKELYKLVCPPQL